MKQFGSNRINNNCDAKYCKVKPENALLQRTLKSKTSQIFLENETRHITKTLSLLKTTVFIQR